MSNVGAYGRDRLEELASRPNTSVMEVQHDFINEPWKVERLRVVMTDIVERALSTDVEVDDFTVRKQLITDHPEILEFQRQHPKLYYLLTDRSIMRDEKSQNAIKAMLEVRTQVEEEKIQDSKEADALATKVVIAALSKE